MKENEKLRDEVDKHQAKLVDIENASGRKQVPLPGKKLEKPVDTNKPQEVAQATGITNESEIKQNESAKKPKQPKVAKPKADDNDNALVDISRLDLRVGKIVEVSKHPDADALYLEKIDVGEPQPRTVISGLVKFVPIEEMQNRLVVLLCNLKPAKMRGITSEAMVMCASTPEKVEVLSPPTNSTAGDLVHCEGYPRTPDAQLNPKKKVLETVLPDLKTNDSLEACYKGAKLLVSAKGTILAQTLKNVNIK